VICRRSKLDFSIFANSARIVPGEDLVLFATIKVEMNEKGYRINVIDAKSIF